MQEWGMTVTQAQANDVLRRVSTRQPLCMADHATVLALIDRGYMTVNPKHDPTDICPYLMTEAGTKYLAQSR